ncbi:HNH endonuclease [Ilumatobacter sp.]|uniref:HNH endonuclease signature motif containing protein n=1 Tax=Ilumatobacter sp. TaxID=1967498 RepID=UPI003C4576F6
MSVNSTDAAFAAVRAVETETLSRDDAERLLGDVRRLRSWLDTVEIATTRRVRELNAAGQAENAESLVAKAGRRSGREAKSVGERTDLSDAVPMLGDALADGDVAAAHLDAINAAARWLPDDVRTEFLGHSDELIGRASQVSVEAFGRECRELAKHLLAASRKDSDADELDAQRAASKVRRWVDRITGMHHTLLELDPLRDAQLSASFNAELARLRAADGNSGTPWQQLQVDAFINAVAGIRTPPPANTASTSDADAGSGAGSRFGTGSSSSVGCGCGSGGAGRPGRRVDRVPQITLLVSLDWLAGVAADGICETENGIPLPISTVRRLCCEAEIIPTVLGTSGEVLDQGRSVRTATEAQRRALRSMHRGCAYPGCEVGFDSCRIHHVRWWGRDNGPTDLANLLPVCERHHHLVHEGGWVLTLDAERIATWTRPDGVVYHTGPTIDRFPVASSA